MSKNLIAIFLLASIIMPLNVTAETELVFLGFSGYITSEAEIENIISFMKEKNLNVYRVSFRPSWYSNDLKKTYNNTLIDYLLENTDFLIVVDGNHLYPAAEQSIYAQNHWVEVRARIFQILSDYGNNTRVAIELINEYVLEDYDILIQELISDIRSQGFTNTLVTNKYSQPWNKFNDPLDATYQGMHFYFNTWSVTKAMQQINIAISKNITKLLNTEVGAHSEEYRAFTKTNVDKLESFLTQSQTLGVINCIWLNSDTKNLEAYKQFYLSPLSSPPPSLPTSPPTKNPTPTTLPTLTQTPTILQPTPTETPESNLETQTPTSTTAKEIENNSLLIAGTIGAIAIASTLGAFLHFKRNNRVSRK